MSTPKAEFEESYQMLLLSVLKRAIEDLSEPGAIGLAAHSWIFEDESREVMSAYWVCQALGMHIEQLRRQVRTIPPSRLPTVFSRRSREIGDRYAVCQM